MGHFSFGADTYLLKICATNIYIPSKSAAGDAIVKKIHNLFRYLLLFLQVMRTSSEWQVDGFPSTKRLNV